MKLCECGCGKPTKIAARNRYRSGHIKGQPIRFINGHQVRAFLFSEGESINLRHGMTGTPEFGAWHNAKDRCTRRTHWQYASYGGRGIKFLFDSFEQFFAELGPRPSQHHSVDRKNNDGHYEPGNVRWATRCEQQANRRPFILSLAQREQIIARRKSGEPARNLATEFGVSTQYVCSLATRSIGGRFPASIR